MNEERKQHTTLEWLDLRFIFTSFRALLLNVQFRMSACNHSSGTNSGFEKQSKKIWRKTHLNILDHLNLFRIFNNVFLIVSF